MRISLLSIAEDYLVKPKFAPRKNLFSIDSGRMIDLGKNNGFKFATMKQLGIDGFGVGNCQRSTKR